MPTKSLTTDLLPSEAATAIQAEQLPVETLKEMYHVMLLIRRVEESLLQMAESGKIGGAMHTAIGHEGGGVGAAYATMGDYVTCTYRGHHHGIARGMDVKRAMAEVLGRADGFAGGKGGSMHFYAPELGMMGANGIVGAQVPQAAGLALASKLRKEGKIAITFFGEGAIFQGVMHETFNIASKWKLPIIFYCENNRYSEMTPTNRTSSIDEIYTFAHTYGMESMQIDGNDVEVVYTAVKQAADRATGRRRPHLYRRADLSLVRSHGRGSGNLSHIRRDRPAAGLRAVDCPAPKAGGPGHLRGRVGRNRRHGRSPDHRGRRLRRNQPLAGCERGVHARLQISEVARIRGDERPTIQTLRQPRNTQHDKQYHFTNFRSQQLCARQRTSKPSTRH